MLQAAKPFTRRFGRRQTTLELDYVRGHGTLGPLLRAVETHDGRVQHLSVEDDDERANGEGMRRVTLELALRQDQDLDVLIDDVRNRPEVRGVRVAGGNGD